VIVTRQRRKSFPFRRLVLPIVAIALLAVALAWPPSRTVISSGPMAPAWRTMGGWFGVVAAPFHFAAQNEVITDRNKQIAVLQNQLTSAQTAAAGKDKQIADLQQQIGQLQTQAASTRSGPPAKARRPSPAATGAFGGGTTGGQNAAVAGDLSTGATADARRTAAYWTSMEPENAAKIAQRLPVAYVARIFALMQPDAVGSILDALPATYAAKITQEHPELQR
jgi:flagellar motility protein MotE (MotC chaperone)